MAVVTPAVSLHQHISKAAGVMWFGAHCCHTPLNEALHLYLADQTPVRWWLDKKYTYVHMTVLIHAGYRDLAFT